MTNKLNLSIVKAIVFSIILISVSFLLYIVISGITGNVNEAHAASCGFKDGDSLLTVNGYTVDLQDDDDEIPVTYLSPDADTTSISFGIYADGRDDWTSFLVNGQETGICDGADSCEYSNDNYSFNDKDVFTVKSSAEYGIWPYNGTHRCEASIIVRNRFGVNTWVSTPTSVTLDSNLDYSGHIEWWSGGLIFEYVAELVSPDGMVLKDTWRYLGSGSGDRDVDGDFSNLNVDPSEDYKVCITASDRNNEGVRDIDCSRVDIKSNPFVDIQGNNTDESVDISWGESVTLEWSSDYASNCKAVYDGGSGEIGDEWSGNISNQSSDGMTFGPFKTPGEHSFRINCDGTLTVPPQRPWDLDAEVTTSQYTESGYVDLTWNDNSNLETYFEVQRYDNDWSTLRNVDGNRGYGNVTYRDNSAQYGERYTYRVRACNGDECSNFSNSRGASLIDTDTDQDECEDPPCQEQFPDQALESKNKNHLASRSFIDNIFNFLGLKAKAQDGNVVGISDTLTVNVGDGPHVDLKVNGQDNGGDDPKGIKLESGEKATLTWDSDKAENCEAFISPSSQQDINWNGGTDTSNTSGVEVGPFEANYEGEIGIGCDGRQPPEPTPPEAPSDLEANSKSTSLIRLSWTDNSNTETRFEIEGRPEPGPKHGCGGPKNYRKIGENDSNDSSYEDSGLADGGNYCYRVKACNDVGCSNPSNFEVGNTYLENPTNLEADTGECSVSLRWDDNSENEDEYQIIRNQEVIETVGANKTRYDDRDTTSFEKGDEIYYSVKACSSSSGTSFGICSSNSNYDSATYTCNKGGGGRVDSIDSTNKNLASYKEEANYNDKSYNDENKNSNSNKYNLVFSQWIDDIKEVFNSVRDVEASNHYDLQDTVPIYVESSPPEIDSMGSSHNLVYDREHTHSPSDNPVASASDTDGDLKNYTWSLIRCADYDGNEYPNCPALTDRNGNISGGSADISGATYTPNEPGHYTLELEVTDESGNTDTETVVESTTECSDGIDNEGDGFIDYGDDTETNDPDCDSLTDEDESAETPGIFDFFFEER